MLIRRPLEFVAVSEPRLVYVGVADREAFDKLDLPLVDHGESEKSGHVLSKSCDDGRVRIVFQYWLKNVALPSEERRLRAAAEGAA